MFVSKSIPTDHKDLIHDVSYDYYGKRMATCSSDQSVKVSNHIISSTHHERLLFSARYGTWVKTDSGSVLLLGRLVPNVVIT